MASLTVMKGTITLRRDLLAHLGIKPSEPIEFNKLPGGELQIKAARPVRTINDFIGRHAEKVRKSLRP